MGQTRKRLTKDGTPRYTGYYEDHRGDRRSAGTYGTEKEAKHAWQDAEAKVRQGKGRQLVRGRRSFRSYVEETWLPNHHVEAKTMENYTYYLYADIMDCFGTMRMIDILPEHIREWLTQLKSGGMTAATRKYVKTLLSTILSSAVVDEVLTSNPALLVKTDPVPENPRQIVTPEQFETFYTALSGEMNRLLIELAIETGMRWGELTELRPKDFQLNERRVTVSRAVVQVARKFHPEGKRFLVKDYPKGRRYRCIKLSPAVAQRVKEYIDRLNLAEDDLLFWYVPQRPAIPVLDVDVDSLGLTEPNVNGKQYKHGTTTAYTIGKCRCPHCKRAMAIYRARRRAEGKDDPRPPRGWDSDGHIPNRWFRDNVLKPALGTSGLAVDIKMHKLRHAHASWLLNGGADLQIVKEQLGHASITTTEKYLHTLDEGSDAAVDALTATRSRARQAQVPIPTPEPGVSVEIAEDVDPEGMTTEQILKQMTRIDELQARLRQQLTETLS